MDARGEATGGMDRRTGGAARVIRAGSAAWLLSPAGCRLLPIPPAPELLPGGPGAPAAPSFTALPWFCLLAGVALGFGLAWLGHRLWLRRGLGRSGGVGLASDRARLAAALATVEDLLAALPRRQVVVELAAWLQERGNRDGAGGGGGGRKRRGHWGRRERSAERGEGEDSEGSEGA